MCSLCREYSSKVELWITFNEPNVMVRAIKKLCVLTHILTGCERSQQKTLVTPQRHIPMMLVDKADRRDMHLRRHSAAGSTGSSLRGYLPTSSWPGNIC